MKEIEVLIDLHNCDMKVSEIMAFFEKWRAENPGRPIWMDGDAYAIVTEAEA